MNLATNLFLVYMIYFISGYIKLAFNKKERKHHQETRQKLEKLRNIAIKTQEQQKQFLDLKYPKSEPFKWSILNVTKIVLQIIFMLSLFIFVRHLWKTYISFEFSLWQVLIVVVILPMITNYILKRFNLHKDDLTIFFK